MSPYETFLFEFTKIIRIFWVMGGYMKKVISTHLKLKVLDIKETEGFQWTKFLK